MNDLIARLRTHDDARLYREADVLMSEAADRIEQLEAQLAAPGAPVQPPYPCPTLESCVEWLEGRGELKLEKK